MEIEFFVSFLFSSFLNFVKVSPNMANATFTESFNRDIQDHKFVKLQEKLTRNFASVGFYV